MRRLGILDQKAPFIKNQTRTLHGNKLAHATRSFMLILHQESTELKTSTLNQLVVLAVVSDLMISRRNSFKLQS